jgi:GWxTD domain-containing protein
MANVLKFTLCSVLLWGTFLQTLSQTIAPREPFRLRADAARFRGDERSIYVEVYYSFPQAGLLYRADSSVFKGGVDLSVIVTMRDSIVFGDRWLVPHVLTDTSRLSAGMNLVGVTNFPLGPGDYRLKILGRDRNDASRKDSVVFRLPVRLLEKENVTLSDLQLASSIGAGSKGSPFFKNTLEVIPNVEGVYTQDQRCYYYVEAYNLLTGSDRSDYVVKSVVFDAVGREVISREKPKKRLNESSVIVDNVTAAKLRTGTYTLTLALLDSSRKVLASAGKKFYVYNASLGIDSTLLSLNASTVANDYATMDEQGMDTEFSWARYEASESEKDQYKKLKGDEPKRKFLSDFWRRRPLGLKEEYLKRVAYTNANHRILGREGYKTDRGRVYIVYGPPDDYDRHPSDSDTRPYEIWTYNSIQGGVIFVFVLRQSGGDYELVHSTHRNELHDENWGRFASTR